MKLILLDNIKKIGTKGSIVTVADGLALGKLIPEKKAIEATPANIAKLEATKKDNKTAVTIDQTYKNQAYAFLNNHTVVLNTHADHHGTLYQSIKPSQIFAVLKDALPRDVVKHLREVDIIIPTPMKKTGDHTYRLYEKEFTVTVKGE